MAADIFEKHEDNEYMKFDRVKIQPLTITIAGNVGTGKTIAALLIQSCLKEAGMGVVIENEFDEPLPKLTKRHIASMEGRIVTIKELQTRRGAYALD